MISFGCGLKNDIWSNLVRNWCLSLSNNCFVKKYKYVVFQFEKITGIWGVFSDIYSEDRTSQI